jgi:hypothetical protein
MDRVVRFLQAIIGSYVDGRRDLTGRRFRCVHLSRGFKAARHLDAEIDVHWRVPVRGMVIKESIVPVCAKSGLAAQEHPNLIQGGTPYRSDVPNRDPASNGGQFPRLNGLN